MSSPSFRITLFAALPALLALPSAKADFDFTRDIRPILSERCFRCHGPDEEARAGGLRLDEYTTAVEVRGGKPAIAPGSPEASELIARIKSHDPSRRMPLGGDRLDDRQIELLEEWISAGAEYERHWAYERPDRPQPPLVFRQRLGAQPDRPLRLEQAGRSGAQALCRSRARCIDAATLP